MTADFTALLETSWAPSAAELPSGSTRLVRPLRDSSEEEAEEDPEVIAKRELKMKAQARRRAMAKAAKRAHDKAVYWANQAVILAKRRESYAANPLPQRERVKARKAMA